ncbi:MAG: hypothetical protein NT159_18055 [Proteobacteria bacterium]|nr:hypothetical protein [Pseudomonadota bacterium]
METTEATEVTAATGADVIVHARFAPDGCCVAISESPSWASPQQWFKLLSKHTVNSYQVLAGGRGLFTIDRQRLDELKAMQ